VICLEVELWKQGKSGESNRMFESLEISLEGVCIVSRHHDMGDFSDIHSFPIRSLPFQASEVPFENSLQV
jgi:hypothetical protein